MKYVAYYRVSTSKQRRSGLGLAAQKEAISDFLKTDDELIAEFTETISGQKDDRTQLAEAIKRARKSGAKILIAKLDRFSRRVSFIARMMESDVGIVVAEMPTASEFQLHIFAALAQEERRMISVRTKAALAQAKLRGVKLGKNGAALATKNKMAAQIRANVTIESLPVGWEGMTFYALARFLNTAGVTTSNGKPYYPQTVKSALRHFKSGLR